MRQNKLPIFTSKPVLHKVFFISIQQQFTPSIISITILGDISSYSIYFTYHHQRNIGSVASSIKYYAILRYKHKWHTYFIS